MLVQRYKVFHNADKYEFQYTEMASSRKMGVWPTDISSMLESEEVFSSLQILMTANSRTQIQATVLTYVCYTVWMNIYYNSPARAKFLVTQHQLCEDNQNRQKKKC